MRRFDAKTIPSSCSDLVLGTSCTKYIDEGQVQGCVHSYRCAKLPDLCDFINQYPNQKLNTVVVITSLNDHRSSIEIFIEHFFIQLIIVKFSPINLVAPNFIPTSCNHLIRKSVPLTTLCKIILILVP